jgi:hypothetical protein
MSIDLSAKHINASNNKHKIVAKIIMNIRNASQIWSSNVIQPTFKTFTKMKGNLVVYEIGPKTAELPFFLFFAFRNPGNISLSFKKHLKQNNKKQISVPVPKNQSCSNGKTASIFIIVESGSFQSLTIFCAELTYLLLHEITFTLATKVTNVN